MTVKARRGISRSKPFRLCCRAPRTTMRSFMGQNLAVAAPRRNGETRTIVVETPKAAQMAQMGSDPISRIRNRVRPHLGFGTVGGVLVLAAVGAAANQAAE